MRTSPNAVQLFFGEATDTHCRIYAIAEGDDLQQPVKLAGTLCGPQCRYAHTLPVTFELRDVSRNGKPLAEAVIPEPCFWTPELPQIYSYSVNLEEVTQTGILGIRRLGTANHDLVFDCKRWVLRGAVTSQLSAPDLNVWHETPLVAVVELPDDKLCEAASEIGVLLVAVIPANTDDMVSQVRRLGRWPAVGIVILENVPTTMDLRNHARNVLFAQRFGSGEPVQPAPWAQLVFCEVGKSSDFANRVDNCPLPIVAVRSGNNNSTTPSGARAECDRLQRELAGYGLDLAGYVV